MLNSKLERQQGPFVWIWREGNWDARNLMNHMDLDEKDKVALLALEFACDWSKP